MAFAIKNNQHLQKIYIRKNNVEDEGLVKLFNILDTIPTLLLIGSLFTQILLTTIIENGRMSLKNYSEKAWPEFYISNILTSYTALNYRQHY